MSYWFNDPTLFVENHLNEIKLWRVNKDFKSPVNSSEYTFAGSITNHLDLVGNSFAWKKSDFDNFAAFLYKYTNVLVNCEGVALAVTMMRETGNGNVPIAAGVTRLQSLDVVNMPHYGLPVPSVQFRAIHYLEGGGSAPTKSSPTEKELLKKLEASKNEVDRVVREEKAENQALKKTIAELEANKTEVDRVVREEKAKNQDLSKKLEASQNELDRVVREVKAKDQDLKKRVLELEAKIVSLRDKEKNWTDDIKIWMNEVLGLQENLHRENQDKLALEKKVSDLTSKLEKCRFAAAATSVHTEPWMNGSVMHSDWVPFENLHAQKFSTSTPLTITKNSSAPDFGQDNTTNILASYFYRGILNNRLVYPIVIVNVADLAPNRERARFDSSVWGLFKNEGTLYAARKATESEMHVGRHTEHARQ